MNLTDIKYLVAVAKAGSINGAAKKLRISQPNISKAIKKVENEYQIKIFERSAIGVTPTDKGYVLISRAEKIVEDLKLLEDSIDDFHHPAVDFKISIPRASYASLAFVEFMNKIKNEQNISVHVMECSSNKALENMLVHGYNMALIRYDMEDEDFFHSYMYMKRLECETIMDFEYRIICSRDSSLAQSEMIDPEQLFGRIELIHGDTSLPDGIPVSHPLINGYPSVSRKVYIYERGSQFDLLQSLPDSFMFVSPMPKVALDRHNLVQRKCSGNMRSMRDVLVKRKGVQLSDVEDMYASHIKDMVKRLK